MNEQQAKEILKQAAGEWFEKMCPGYDSGLLIVRFDLRGTTAGQARLTWLVDRYVWPMIRINLPMALENWGDYIDNTIPHEIAHLAANMLHNRNVNHGPEWKAIMRAHGLEPTRCHSYDTNNHVARRVDRSPYKCANCGHVYELTAYKVKKLAVIPRYYVCGNARCRGTLEAQ